MRGWVDGQGEEALSSIPSPYAETGPAYGMTTSSAVLTAMVYPGGEETGLYDTKYRFEYGTTTGYGSDSSEGDAGSEITGRAVTVTIGSLSSGTTYHYRVVAWNSKGTYYGQDETLTTLSGAGLSNGTFALGATTGCGSVEDWSFFAGGGTQTACAVQNGEKAEQGGFLEELTDSVSGGSIYQDVPFSNGATNSSEIGDTYTYSIWLRAPSKEEKGTVAVWGLTAAGEATDSAGTNFTLAGGGWQHIEVPLTVSKAGETHIRVQVYQYAANAAMYLDNAMLVQQR